MNTSHPEEIIIRFSPFRFLKMLSPFFILLALSFWLNWNAWISLSQNERILWGLLIAFMVFIFVALYKGYFLILNKEGFTVNFLFGKRNYPWPEVSNFKVLETRIHFIPLAKRINFDLRVDSSQRTEMIRASRTLRNLIPNRGQAFDSSFMSLFKPDAESLVEILNDFQTKSPIR